MSSERATVDVDGQEMTVRGLTPAEIHEVMRLKVAGRVDEAKATALSLGAVDPPLTYDQALAWILSEKRGGNADG